MKIELPENVLDIMIDRLTQEDILFLEYLIKNKAINPSMGLTKTKILKGIDKLTDFKFQITSNRLYLALLVDRSNTSKPITFFVTKAGVDIVKQFKKNAVESMKEMR